MYMDIISIATEQNKKLVNKTSIIITLIFYHNLDTAITFIHINDS